MLSEADVESFKQEAHEHGVSREQYQWLMQKYLSQLPVLAGGLKAHDVQEATAELRQQWTTDADFTLNIARADNAIRHYAGPDAAGIFKDYGTDPRIARMMAKIGAKMGEGRAPSNVLPPIGGEERMQQIRTSEAYRDAKHPDHQRLSLELRRLGEERYGNQPI